MVTMKSSSSLNRRKFLRQTSLGIGAGLALPNIFLNKTFAATGENPSELVRIGVIGTGGQGLANMRAIMKNVVAVCDVDTKHAANAAALVEKANGRKPTVASDYRKLLEDKSVDAVLIATPDHWHALPAIEACLAGKDVYCEKPLTLFIEEGKTLVKAARKHNRIVQCGSQQRSEAKFLKAAEYVRNGRIGKIKRVLVGLVGVNWTKDPLVADSEPPAELDYNMWLGPAPYRPYNKQRVHYYFRFFWDYSGGQMTNWGAHHLDITQWALGMDNSGPTEITGKGEFDPQKRFEVPSAFGITYKYANGVVVECQSPTPKVAPLIPDRLEQAKEILDGKTDFTGCIFEGEKGLLYVNRGVIRVWPEEVFETPLSDSDVRLHKSTQHHQDWLASIKSRKLPICDVAIGHRSATVCHLGNIAIRSGRKIQWDPVKEVVVGDPEAARLTTKEYRAPWKLPQV
jgi:predicted dehydrogenase